MLDSLALAAELVARARPDVARPAEQLLASLERRAVGAAATVFLHGDLHPKNALLSPSGRIGLIDFDQAAPGNPAADVGGLLAGLRYDAVVGRVAPAAAERLSAAFLAGYRALRELPGEAELRWHVAAALLAERALRAVNRVREPGLRRLPAVLADAREVLDG